MCVYWSATETDRDRQKQTYRQAERHTERQTGRETETDRELEFADIILEGL